MNHYKITCPKCGFKKSHYVAMVLTEIFCPRCHKAMTVDTDNKTTQILGVVTFDFEGNEVKND